MEEVVHSLSKVDRDRDRDRDGEARVQSYIQEKRD